MNAGPRPRKPSRLTSRQALGIAAILAVVAAFPVLAQSALPDPARTPGALNPAVTQEGLN
jgi:hypothetical protein